MAVLLVSHDFGVIAQVCDRVAVMYGGHIVETGPIEAIYQRRPSTPTRARCWSPSRGSSRRGARRASTAIPGAPPDLDRAADGLRVQAALPLRPAEAAIEVSMALETVAPGHETACPVRPFAAADGAAAARAGAEA